MGITAIPAAVRYAALGAGAGTLGLLATNQVASRGDGVGTTAAAGAAVSSASGGAFLRSSMAKEPHLRPFAAMFTGLGLGGIGGIGLTAFQNGAEESKGRSAGRPADPMTAPMPHGSRPVFPSPTPAPAPYPTRAYPPAPYVPAPYVPDASPTLVRVDASID